jgi:hypothetical protein
MKVSSITASSAWPVSKSANTRTATKDTDTTSSDSVAGNFLKYAKMSPLERMRANILKGMNMTEDQLSALSLQERQKVEDQIKDQVKKLMANNGGTDRLVDIRA